MNHLINLVDRIDEASMLPRSATREALLAELRSAVAQAEAADEESFLEWLEGVEVAA